MKGRQEEGRKERKKKRQKEGRKCPQTIRENKSG